MKNDRFFLDFNLYSTTLKFNLWFAKHVVLTAADEMH